MNEYLNKIIQSEALTILKQIPDECIDMIITSPPYWGLRKYGDYKEQIGLEETFEEYLKKILEITMELKRVLKPSGCFFLNLGDCYGGSPAGNKSISKARAYAQKIKMGEGAKSFVFSTDNERMFSGKPNNSRLKQTAGQKCLMMMPERIALALIDQQGFILRNKIVWAKQILDFKERKTKGSVMPSSVKDRFNESYEFLYFFVKNKKYYSDLDAVRLPNQVLGVTDFRENRGGFIDPAKLYKENSKYFGHPENPNKFNYRVRDAKRKAGQPQFKASEEEIKNYKKQDNVPSRNAATYTGFTKRWKDKKAREKAGVPATYIGATGEDHNLLNNPLGKNLPTVWFIGSEPHNFQKELDGIDTDHFAIFPQALLEIPIKFGSPLNGIILDPFCGSGQTAIMAKKLGRNFIGIELNKEYCEIARKRINLECGELFYEN